MLSTIVRITGVIAFVCVMIELYQKWKNKKD